MITIFPPEIILEVLSYLTLTDLSSLNVLSKPWDSLVQEQSSTIYRSAAYLHSFIDSPYVNLHDAIGERWDDSWDSVTDWKAFCKKTFLVERSWIGEGFARIRKFPGAGDGIHRVKVDETERTLITTMETGGLKVSCISTGELLFELPTDYASPFSHLEFSNGFMVFNGPTHDSLQVWCRSSQISSYTPSPQPFQSRVLSRVLPHPINTETTGRGIYQPYGIIRNAWHTRAYRFTFPELIVASGGEVRETNIWNIPSLTLAQTIDLAGGNFDPETNSFSYVDINAENIFVCTAYHALVHSRSNEERTLSIPGIPAPLMHSNPVTLDEIKSNETIAISPIYPTIDGSIALTLGFTAIHVSPNGKDLVAVSASGYLFYVCDFDIRDAQTRQLEKMFTLMFPSRVNNMAFDGKRIAVSTNDTITVVTLTSPSELPIHPSTPLPPFPPPPDVPTPLFGLDAAILDVVGQRPRMFPCVRHTVQVIKPKRSGEFVPFITALQLTSTALWYNWSDQWEEFEHAEISFSDTHVECVDFGSEPAEEDL